MKTKDKRIEMRVSEKDYAEISSNASALGLPVGTYLRMLGMLGIAPFISKALPGSSRFQKYTIDGVEDIVAENQEVIVQRIHSKIAE